jgi:hypothetical protein
MKIRKNNIVKTNIPLTVGVYDIKTLPVGTLLQVWKTTKQGELYCTTLDRKLCSHTVITNEASVTKEEQPLPTVKVGDIFVSSWGYDQTNIEYTGHMNGRCVPNPDVVGKKTLTKRIMSMQGLPCFKITNYASAYPWSGLPCGFSEWA